MVRSPCYPHQGGAISVLSTPKCGADKAYLILKRKIMKHDLIVKLDHCLVNPIACIVIHLLYSFITIDDIVKKTGIQFN